jgi:hypothetical protein
MAPHGAVGEGKLSSTHYVSLLRVVVWLFVWLCFVDAEYDWKIPDKTKFLKGCGDTILHAEELEKECWQLKHVTTFDPQAYGPTPFSPKGDP